MSLGRMLMVLGAVLFAAGVLVQVTGRFRLPGDIVIRGKNSVFYFPLATCLVLSLIGSLLLWLFRQKQ